MFRRLWFAFAYRFTKPRWDTGTTPPEVVDLIEKQKLQPGRALDLGCGTGTNVLYLAEHGWKVVGVDFVGQAIETAKRKAQAAKTTVEFFQGDVTKLDFLSPSIDFALDIGCFHSIPVPSRPAYVAELVRLVRPGGLFLCYAFKPEARMGGLAVEEMQTLFGPNFETVKIEHGQGTPSAWYTFERR
jgi:ubiquinone/menaquinone biosynthesis C-methylase UbiE